MAKFAASNGTIKVDTAKVKETVSVVNGVNDNLDRSFEEVTTAIKRLDSSWDSLAASEAILKFNKINCEFCGPIGRSAVMKNYLKFLSDAVAIGYETTENTNTKLSELFK